MNRYLLTAISLGVFGVAVLLFIALRAPRAADGITTAYQGFQEGKCKSCHPAIWREWENSTHAQAWRNDIYQEAARHVPDRETKCDQCHAPEPILTTGIGKMPKLRDRDRAAGVSCLVCHLDAAGAMHGPPATAETSFHANVTNPNYTDPTRLCSTCHGQPTVPEHDQVSSFLQSRFAAEDQSCATCHMPSVNRLQSTASYERMKGRKHTWRGSRSVSQLRRAARLYLEVVPGKANVTLESRTGHLLPGGFLRTLVVQTQVLSPEGTERQKERTFIRAAEENRLLPNEKRTYSFDLRASTPGDTLTVKVMYQLTPTTPESEWVLMAEKTELLP